MKRYFSILLAVILLVSCGPKPQYKTRQGRKKQKYYNMHQYDHNQRDRKLIKNMKKKN